MDKHYKDIYDKRLHWVLEIGFEPTLGRILTMLRDEGHIHKMSSVLPFTFMVPISQACDKAVMTAMRERYSMGSA